MMKEKYEIYDMRKKDRVYKHVVKESLEELETEINEEKYKVKKPEISLEKSLSSKTWGVKNKIIPERVKKYTWIFIDGENILETDKKHEKLSPSLLKTLVEETLTDSWLKSLFVGSGVGVGKYWLLIIFVVIGVVIFVLRGLGVI